MLRWQKRGGILFAYRIEGNLISDIYHDIEDNNGIYQNFNPYYRESLLIEIDIVHSIDRSMLHLIGSPFESNESGLSFLLSLCEKSYALPQVRMAANKLLITIYFDVIL